MFLFGLIVFLIGALGIGAAIAMSLGLASAQVSASPTLIAANEMIFAVAGLMSIVGAIFMGCGAIRNEIRKRNKHDGKHPRREPSTDDPRKEPRLSDQNHG